MRAPHILLSSILLLAAPGCALLSPGGETAPEASPTATYDQLDAMADAAEAEGRVDDQVALRSRALTRARAAGLETETHDRAQVELAGALLLDGDERGALEHYALARRTAEAVYGDGSAELAVIYMHVSAVYEVTGDRGAALSNAREAHSICREVCEPAIRASSARRLGDLTFRNTADVDGAIELFEEAIESYPEGPEYAGSVALVAARLAEAMLRADRAEEAIPVIETTLDRVITQLGADHPAVGTLTRASAEAYVYTDRREDGQVALSRAEEIGRSHGDTALLAHCARMRGVHFQAHEKDWDAAKASLRYAIDLLEESEGPRSTQTAKATYELGVVFFLNEEWPDALEHAERAAELLADVRGYERAFYADAAALAGRASLRMEDGEAALPSLRAARDIYARLNLTRSADGLDRPIERARSLRDAANEEEAGEESAEG